MIRRFEVVREIGVGWYVERLLKLRISKVD